MNTAPVTVVGGEAKVAVGGTQVALWASTVPVKFGLAVGALPAFNHASQSFTAT
jgi:hypothetical protein